MSEGGSDKGYLLRLSLAALGVVFGDIGTSPLYALRESFHYGLPADHSNVLGVLSLIVWSLILVICLKYLVFVLRADHNGEGGILALTALVMDSEAKKTRIFPILILIGLFGTALLYGDGMITPAISVLSAVEGLEVATPVFRPWVLPLTVLILIGLFWAQAHGTEKVGKVFGPITLVWFLSLATLGIYNIILDPAVFAAFDPMHGLDFFARNGMAGFFVLGSVFLVVTGGEALYADIGHFGKVPIRLAWFTVVMPALLLNYLGQGALVLHHPQAVQNPFYRMVPGWGLYPMVVLATAATVIASQALISGAFSLTLQAMQLDYVPRLLVEHTSETEIGQIYIPSVNWALMLACIMLVLGFGSSSALAAAYGVAVTMTMVITTVLFYLLTRYLWHWNSLGSALLCGFFAIIDVAFTCANMVKVADGGWFPLMVAGIVFAIMTTWRRGRSILGSIMRGQFQPIDKVLAELEAEPPVRIPGTAIYMTGNPDYAPPALMRNLKYYRALHEQVVTVSVIIEDRPRVPETELVSLEELAMGLRRVAIHYGYMDEFNVPRALQRLEGHGLTLKHSETTYFLGREAVLPGDRPHMARWRQALFAFLNRNARNATAFFAIPSDRMLELGSQIRM